MSFAVESISIHPLPVLGFATTVKASPIEDTKIVLWPKIVLAFFTSISFTNFTASLISFDLAFARLIKIRISFFSLLANSIIDSVAQKSTWEGDIGIRTKSAISIAGLPSASIFGGVSIMTISHFSFIGLASYCAPQKLAVLNWRVLLSIS